jgi:hypothetical protein
MKIIKINHWNQGKYPMDIRYVHWIHWTCTCPQLFILTGKLYPNFHILSSSNGTKFLKLPIRSIHLSVIQACLWQRKGLNLFSLTFTKYAINLSQALIKVFRIWIQDLHDILCHQVRLSYLFAPVD